jgi:hypothetical protein
MGLQDQLDQIRQGFEKQAPPEALAVMHRATDDLRKSGIMNRISKAGESAPMFELNDSQGNPVSLSGLLEKGHLLMSFFRGSW